MLPSLFGHDFCAYAAKKAVHACITKGLSVRTRIKYDFSCAQSLIYHISHRAADFLP